jgi:predicted enzyme related to lactoylglutathione lyase
MLLRIWDVTFTVAHLERAVAFYENVLGLSKKYYFPEDYAGFDCGGIEIGLTPGILHDRGVHFVKEPHDTAWGGRIALFVDPDGNILQLTQIDWGKYFTVCARG